MDVLAYLSSLSLIVPFLTGLFSYSRFTKLQKTFWVFIIFSTLFEATVFSFAYSGLNTFTLFKIFLVCDFLFISWFYYRCLPLPLWLKILIITMAGIILIHGVPQLSIRPDNYPDLYFYIFVFLFFILQSAYMIVALFDNFDISPVERSLFWIASGRIFYFLITLSIYVYTNFVTNSFDSQLYSTAFLIINSTGNIICNLMYSANFLCRKI